MDQCFTRQLLVEKIKLKPSLLGHNIPKILTKFLVAKFEAKCSQYGYIQPGSIELFKYSVGQLIAASLNGDVLFVTQFYANVCNPLIGQVIKAKVVNANKFGILAEVSLEDNTPVLEIIIAKNTSALSSDIDLNNISLGEVVNVEVMGKKFELKDKKISIVGRVVKEGGATKTKIQRIVKQSTSTSIEEDELELEDDLDDLEADEENENENENDNEEDDKEADEPEVEPDQEDEKEESEEEIDEFDVDDDDIGGSQSGGDSGSCSDIE